MIRGTTPTLYFNIPFETSLIDLLYITFNQGSTILEKTKDDCKLEEKAIILPLPQQDTLKFTAKVPIEIQIRCKTHEGEALASEIIVTFAERILHDGEI